MLINFNILEVTSVSFFFFFFLRNYIPQTHWLYHSRFPLEVIAELNIEDSMNQEVKGVKAF